MGGGGLQVRSVTLRTSGGGGVEVRNVTLSAFYSHLEVKVL